MDLDAVACTLLATSTSRTCSVGTELLELGASLLLGAAVPPAPGGLLAVGVGGGTGAGPLAVGSRPAPARAAAGTGKLEPEARTLVSVAAAAFGACAWLCVGTRLVVVDVCRGHGAHVVHESVAACCRMVAAGCCSVPSLCLCVGWAQTVRSKLHSRGLRAMHT